MPDLWCGYKRFAAAMHGILICALLVPALLNSQDSRGTNFWIAFSPGLTRPVVFITAQTDATGIIEIPGLNYSVPFSVAAGASSRISLPSLTPVSVNCVDCVETKGVNIRASCDVSVYGFCETTNWFASFLGLPTKGLGKQYAVHALWNLYENECRNNSPYPVGSGCGTELIVLATRDNTKVTVVPSVTTRSRAAKVPYEVTLNKGQTYRLANTQSGTIYDLSGSFLVADNPIAVYGGWPGREIPAGELCCYEDGNSAQIPSNADLGVDYLVVPFKYRTAGDLLRMVAVYDGTQIRIDGNVVANLDRGEIYEKSILAPVHVVSSTPFLLAQCMKSWHVDNLTGDTEIMIVTATDRFLDRYVVMNEIETTEDWEYHCINVVVPTAVKDSCTLDGTTLPAGDFIPIGDSGYSGLQVTVGSGAHNLSCPAPFGAYVYGMGDPSSYAYSAGMQLASAAIRLELSPATATPYVETEQCVRVRVENGAGVPQEDVAILLTCQGINTWEFTGETDANGEVEYCYSSDKPGEDEIAASILCCEDAACQSNATVNWQPPVPPPAPPPPPGPAPIPKEPEPYMGPLRVFPNPFVRSEAVRGTVKFEGLKLGSRIRIYTSRGLKVWEREVERPYIVEWDGRNEAGKSVVPGAYLWVAEHDEIKEQGTLVVE